MSAWERAGAGTTTLLRQPASSARVLPPKSAGKAFYWPCAVLAESKQGKTEAYRCIPSSHPGCVVRCQPSQGPPPLRSQESALRAQEGPAKQRPEGRGQRAEGRTDARPTFGHSVLLGKRPAICTRSSPTPVILLFLQFSSSSQLCWCWRCVRERGGCVRGGWAHLRCVRIGTAPVAITVYVTRMTAEDIRKPPNIHKSHTFSIS